MSWKPPRTFAVVFVDGDSVIDGLQTFAAAEELPAASFTAIGAFSRATLAFFDVEDTSPIVEPDPLGPS